MFLPTTGFFLTCSMEELPFGNGLLLVPLPVNQRAGVFLDVCGVQHIWDGDTHSLCWRNCHQILVCQEQYASRVKRGLYQSKDYLYFPWNSTNSFADTSCGFSEVIHDKRPVSNPSLSSMS